MNVPVLFALPLNLGDCFAYALAVVEDCPVLALDQSFHKTDCRIVSPYSTAVFIA
jgi:uncharacterized protein with PIN domain